MENGILTFAGIHVHWLDFSLIVTYLVGMVAFGIYYSRHVNDAHDYFLAGRSLPWWIIGMSIIGSNIGSNDYVGAAGGAYKIGIAQANFEWIGAIPAMILAAFLFIPYYWRAGVYSVPEYLGLRYNQTVRLIAGIILSIFNLFIIGVFLWATATMLQVYIGLDLTVGILITAFVVGVYTITGGLAAVAISDSVQLAIMFVGGAALGILGVIEVGGPEVFWQRLTTEYPDHLNAFLPADHAEFPWPGVLLGLGLVLSPAYWCANQVILQRTLAARSQWDGQASMIFAALAKSMVPLLIVLPGLVALLLYQGTLEEQDQALPWIIREVMPPGLSGLLFVAFIAALQSSVDSTLNATAVMVTRDIVGVVRPAPPGTDPESAGKRDLRLGQWVTFGALFIGVVFAINLDAIKALRGIYSLVQLGLSYFQGPLFALILMGILTRRVTAVGGLASLVGGVAAAVAMGTWGLPGTDGPMNMLYIAFWSFVGAIVLMFVVSAFTRRKSDEELRNLTIFTTH